LASITGSRAPLAQVRNAEGRVAAADTAPGHAQLPFAQSGAWCWPVECSAPGGVSQLVMAICSAATAEPAGQAQACAARAVP